MCARGKRSPRLSHNISSHLFYDETHFLCWGLADTIARTLTTYEHTLVLLCVPAQGGRPPLCLAVSGSKSAECVKALINAGVAIHTTDKARSPLVLPHGQRVYYVFAAARQSPHALHRMETPHCTRLPAMKTKRSSSTCLRREPTQMPRTRRDGVPTPNYLGVDSHNRSFACCMRRV